MTPAQPPRKQTGAVLLVALIMLLILTILSISTMRGVTLESRLTNSRMSATKLDDAADATLREAEYRFYGPAYLRDKLEPNAANCHIDNELNDRYLNKPCLLSLITTPSSRLQQFVQNPAVLTEANKDTYLNPVSRTGLAWMPYRGRDTNEATTAMTGADAGWNTYLITGGPAENVPINVEYGASGEGRGTFFYLVNGRVNTTATQSTVANVYLGLNN